MSCILSQNTYQTHTQIHVYILKCMHTYKHPSCILSQACALNSSKAQRFLNSSNALSHTYSQAISLPVKLPVHNHKHTRSAYKPWLWLFMGTLISTRTTHIG